WQTPAAASLSCSLAETVVRALPEFRGLVSGRVPLGRAVMADHPIKPTNFLKYAKSPLLRYMLRIIPAGAKLSAASKIKPELLGKIPGTMTAAGEWTGFDWPSNATTQLQLMGWQQQQANSGV